MAFQPSQYSDASSLALTLTPLVLDAGTQIATTAITHGSKSTGSSSKARHAASAPAPAAVSDGIPTWMLVSGGGAVVLLIGALAFGLGRTKKKAPAEA